MVFQNLALIVNTFFPKCGYNKNEEDFNLVKLPKCILTIAIPYFQIKKRFLFIIFNFNILNN